MKIVVIIARVLLGLMFFVLGLNGFLLFMPPPAAGIPHNVVLWNTAMFSSHYIWMTSGVQVIVGVLLLLNRYLKIALIVCAALLLNILTFHITMWPQALFPLPLLAFVLWFIVCWPIRREFAPLFSARTLSR